MEKTHGVSKVILDGNEVGNYIKLEGNRKIYHIEVIM